MLHVFHFDLKTTDDLLRFLTVHVSPESLGRGLLSSICLALQAEHHGARDCLLLSLADEGHASLAAEKIGSDHARAVKCGVSAVYVAAAIWYTNGYWTIHRLIHHHLGRGADLGARIKGICTGSSLRLLPAYIHSMHCLDVEQVAFKGVYGGTLRLITQRVPLEPVVVRTIVQITLGLV